MKSFNTLHSNFGSISENTATATVTLSKTLINDSQGVVLAYADWPFLEFTNTDRTTVDGQNYYQLPNKMKKLISLAVTVGTTRYRPKPVEDPSFWEYLQSLNTSESDATQYYYRIGNLVYLYPTPATDGYTITMRGTKKWKDMSLDDYTTGTITTATNGDETIVGSGTTWTGRNPIDGQWIRIAAGASSGDYQWYEISSITDNTNLELVKKYEGTSITAGSVGYTMGEFSIIPGEFHDLMLWRALAIWFSTYSQKGGEMTRAERFWRMYDGGYEAGLESQVGGLLGRMMEQEFEKNTGIFLESSDEVVDDVKRFKIDTISGESWG